MKSNKYFFMRAIFVYKSKEDGPTKEFAVLENNTTRNCALLSIKGVPSKVHSTERNRFCPIGKIVTV